MYQTLILVGIACILAAVVGGGLSAFGMKIPPLSGAPRVLTVIVCGVVLIVIGVLIKPKSTQVPTGVSATMDLVGHRTAAYCPANVTFYGSITTTGGDGTVTVSLKIIPDAGSTTTSPSSAVPVHGAGTYYFNETTLFRASEGGDVQWMVDSPVSEGSNIEAFSLTC
jgi:hypothetical protein